MSEWAARRADARCFAEHARQHPADELLTPILTFDADLDRPSVAFGVALGLNARDLHAASRRRTRAP